MADMKDKEIVLDDTTIKVKVRDNKDWHPPEVSKVSMWWTTFIIDFGKVEIWVNYPPDGEGL